MFLLLLCVTFCAVVFMAVGNTHPAMAAFGGVITGFIVWAVISFVMFMGSAFGCNSLDADDMCVDYGNGEVR